MSVINKMLRDLDQRAQLPGGVSAQPPPAHLPAAAPARSSPRVPAWLLALLAGLLALLAAASWWWQKAADGSAAPAAPLAQATTQVPATPAPPAPAMPPATSVPPVPPVPSLTSVPLVPPVLAVAPVAARPAPSAPAPVATVAAVTTPMPAPARAVAAAVGVQAPAPVVHAATVVAPASAVATAEPQVGTTRQLQAGRDALAQAQSQWNAGAHDAATELLQAAIATLERSSAAAPSAAQTQLLAALVRELARMQLAEGRAGAALETLARQEPQLGREADIWAMRGNAAQRLGKHQDSVLAYSTALQLRPNEQRWMLGSAVSLAALGQTANAADLADRARALGPISKEVQAYLRLAGVRLTEP